MTPVLVLLLIISVDHLGRSSFRQKYKLASYNLLIFYRHNWARVRKRALQNIITTSLGYFVRK